MLLNILIGFFIFLISYQIILATNPIIEGAQCQDTASKALDLAQDNSASIKQINLKLEDSEKKTTERIERLETQVNEISTQNAKLGEEMADPQPAPGSE